MPDQVFPPGPSRGNPADGCAHLVGSVHAGSEIFLTQDGSHTVVAERYGVSYHSKYGAIRESMHVFIEAGLRPYLYAGGQVAVLEAGLGTGLNVFLTYLAAKSVQAAIYYEALEAFPLEPEFAAQLNYPSVLGVPEDVGVFSAIHREAWDHPVFLGPKFQFRKIKGKFEAYRGVGPFDVIYYDAFSPGAQPEVWKSEVLAYFYASLRPGGTMVTYCAKGEVKRTLKALGFEIEALPGPPGKREMVRAIKR